MMRNTERFLGAVLLTALLIMTIGCGGGDAPLGESSLQEQATGPEVAQVGPDGMVRVIVSLQSRAGNVDRTMVANAGGRARHMYRHVSAMSADVPEQAIEALGRNPRVTAVERAGITHACEAELVLPKGVIRIDDRVPPALPEGANRGGGALVAIIDSGIDHNHPDLAGNYSDIGYDFVNLDTDPMDDNGHGTHCAGIVAANKPIDTSYGIVGVAPDATLCAYKALGADGSGTTDDLVAAIDEAISDGVDVASISMGSSVGNTELENVCAEAEAAGIVLVAAAGNEGRRSTRFDNVLYPAKYATVIAVGATDDSDTRPTFSSTGEALELCAPGVNIFSTYLTTAGDPIGYRTMSGTSMACPHVSGSAALAVASGLSGAALRAWLVETADDLGPAGRDVEYGYGMVDADEAAREGLNTAPSVSVVSPADGASFDSGASIGFSGSASDLEDGNLSANLVWTSDVDGQIGTGGSFSAVLSDGTHEITASVTDSGGLTGSASITVTVASSGGALVVTVDTDQDTYTTGDTAYITVSVTDGASAVSGASVSMRLTTPKGKVYTESGTTDTNGDAVFDHYVFTRRDGSGTYAVDTTASATGYEDGTASTTFVAE